MINDHLRGTYETRLRRRSDHPRVSNPNPTLLLSDLTLREQLPTVGGPDVALVERAECVDGQLDQFEKVRVDERSYLHGMPFRLRER